MKKKKSLIICLFLVILLFIMIFSNNSNKYFIELKSREVIDKINKKESFVLCISQTTCSHCASYKPKLKKLANKYNTNIYYMESDLLSKKEREQFNKYIYYSGTPTTIFIVNGEEKTTASRLSGDVATSKVTDKLKQFNFIH